MPAPVTRPRGTADVLPDAAGAWRRLEAAAHELGARYGFGEIRTPTFEHSDLIHHVGEHTDVVQRETYDFADRGGRQLTLRPEGTAPVVRACLEGGLLGRGLPVKLYYVTMAQFRYERPQAGRLREHHQFGCEVFGAAEPAVDAELIEMVSAFLQGLEVRAQAHINSIGCPRCRPAYRAALVAYYTPLAERLCADCRRRLSQNPLRLLDCKVDHEAALGAPHATDHLDPECRAHFEAVQSLLAAVGVAFEVDHLLVRGFDYYTRTVFEFMHEDIGAQASVGGGGRYDGLVEALGGPPTPAAGYAMGMERLLLALPHGVAAPPSRCDLFVSGAATAALRLCTMARHAGIAADFDPMGRSLRAQFRHADRLGARFVAVPARDGPAGSWVLRDMQTHAERTVGDDAVPAEVSAALESQGA